MQAILNITKKDTTKFVNLIKALLNNDEDCIEVIINNKTSFADDTDYLNSTKANKKILEKRIKQFEQNKKDCIVFENIDELISA
jgi:hypothetical protein